MYSIIKAKFVIFYTFFKKIIIITSLVDKNQILPLWK